MSLPLPARLRSGDLLDQYRIEGLVATGGMASIFRATDTKTGRTVAVKIPHSEKASDRLFLSRFHRETEIGRKFDHPGLVKVLPNDGACHRYAVMEWVEGQLLRQLIDDRTHNSIERAVQIALKICDVLEFIHERGIAHLDLKPDNIIVGSSDSVKLIDFDIARETRRGFWALLRPSRTGTPHYASPEQIRGKSVDARSDIYSLGVILYEMLTGEVPFSGVGPSTALYLKMAVDPVAPREINPEIPTQLQNVVCRSIARDPTKRPASAREVSADLKQASRFGVLELVESL